MMLITVNDNPNLEALNDFIVGGCGIFIFDEEFGTLAALIETREGFAFTDIHDCVRLGAPENGKIEEIKKKKPRQGA